jgi:hypothetical protein
MNNISEIQEGDSFESQPQSLDLEGDEDDTVQLGNVINHEGAEQQPAAFYNDLHIDKDCVGCFGSSAVDRRGSDAIEQSDYSIRSEGPRQDANSGRTPPH